MSAAVESIPCTFLGSKFKCNLNFLAVQKTARKQAHGFGIIWGRPSTLAVQPAGYHHMRLVVFQILCEVYLENMSQEYGLQIFSLKDLVLKPWKDCKRPLGSSIYVNTALPCSPLTTSLSATTTSS